MNNNKIIKITNYSATSSLIITFFLSVSLFQNVLAQETSNIGNVVNNTNTTLNQTDNPNIGNLI